MSDKKRLAQKMIQGVDVVKLVLYKLFTKEFLKKYTGKNEEFCKDFAASLVNEIFGCHVPRTEKFFIKNKIIAVEEIKNFGVKYPKLKRPITNALRVFVQANFMLSGKLQDDFGEIFDNATERGIFIKGGKHPEPKSFLEMTEKLIKDYNL